MSSEYGLPKRSHLVHKPIEPRNLSAKLRNVDYSDDVHWLWQLKYDGCNMMVVVCEGKGTAFSRTGEVVKSCQHIVEALEALPHTHIVWFGEAYSRDLPHSEINGMFRKQSPQPALGFVIFDSVPLSCFEHGSCDIGYQSRLTWTEEQVMRYKPSHCSVAHTFAPSRIESTESLINHMRDTCELPFELDGYVAKRKGGLWIAGAGKGGEQIKVKDHLSLDLRCVGLVEGKGKFSGMVGAVQVEYNGQVLEVGGGKLTDEERREYWKLRDTIGFGLIGKIVEVHALASSTHGKLREPRFIRVRHDKQEPDA